MAYIALYRKFRPVIFQEVIGQEHITQTIRNQIQHNRIGHAYLFSGGRGSGKTSTAKILARAVNCLDPKDGEPCNECEMCKQALEGTLVDITEMDAASNNGVDNIRDIREEVQFVPTRAQYRVYIIDEVHMLSAGAFNALLKTLEEPPKHVIFILATTEPQKLPATILSRCQRFDFKKLSVENIMKNLRMITEACHVQAEENALRFIASLAEGAMRDAISILDRIISYGETNITENKVRELTGVPDFEYLINMCKGIVDYQVENILQCAERLIKDGKDVNVFLWELIKTIRDMLILETCGDLDNYSKEQKMVLKEISQKAGKERLVELIEKLSDLESKMKWSSEQIILFETGLIKLCMITKNEEHTFNDEKRISFVSEGEKTKNEREVAPLITESDSRVSLKEKVLTKLKENGKIIMHSKILNSRIEQLDDTLVHIIFDSSLDDFGRAVVQKDESKMAIKDALKTVMGREMSIRYIFEKK